MNTTTSSSNKTRILLVEDDPNLSLVLKDYLEILLYETVFAENGEDALDLFQSEHFDCKNGEFCHADDGEKAR